MVTLKKKKTRLENILVLSWTNKTNVIIYQNSRKRSEAYYIICQTKPWHGHVRLPQMFIDDVASDRISRMNSEVYNYTFCFY